MDELIIKSLRGEASDFEVRKLRTWRQASPSNERRFQELTHIWELGEVGVTGASDRADPPFALMDIVRLAEERRAAAKDSLGGQKRRLWRSWGLAAAVVLAAGIGLVRARMVRPGIGTIGVAEFATGRGETVTVTLTDGSFVRLAPHSRLRFEKGYRNRSVWLDGRAFFAVAKDSSHPFTVHTNVGEALALGTRFELRTGGADLRLIVVEGRVALSAAGAKVELGPGEMSHVTGGTPPSVVRMTNVSQLLDWPGGLLVFQSTPLAQVASEMGRYYRRRLTIVDSMLARRLVTVWFTDETFEEALTTVCRVANAQCSIQESGVTVAR